MKKQVKLKKQKIIKKVDFLVKIFKKKKKKKFKNY